MVKKNSCVFISGAGTNLKALIDSSRDYRFPINIKLVVSNKKNAPGLVFAKKYSIPFKIINTKESLFEIKILNEIKKRKISLICLAGYMKILSKNFIKNYKGKILNIHPSLLPKYKGTNTFSRILNNKEKVAGCTVHFVNEKLDSGKIILKKSFEIYKNENVKTLKKKTQKTEYRAFSEAITKLHLMN
jgi:formyltetrahydrofolate-dependent phosphoribosylglycinamide formyltransferase